MIVIKNALPILDIDNQFVMGMQYQSRTKISCSCSC
jgi:hypothetical protein